MRKRSLSVSAAVNDRGYKGLPMPAETVDAIVLGAGFVGVSAALALQARGRRVALVDRHAGAAGETSFGNAGIVQTEAVMPYVFPRAPSAISAARSRNFGAMP